MKIIATYDFTIPVWTLSALINGDESGIDRRDSNIIDAIEGTFDDLVKKHNAHSYTIDLPEDIDSEKYFGYDDFGEFMGDVIDIEIHIFGKE
jgi:hypothetical protein